jgi:hypothetical protein
MAYIISLDKRLLRVVHKFTRQQVEEFLKQVTPEQFQEQIQRQLYQQFLAGAAKTIPTIVKSTPEEQIFTVTGYILSEKDMNMLIKELLEFDEISKQQMLDKVNSIIYGKTDKNIIYGEETMQND